jgi:hypothetical protein
MQNPPSNNFGQFDANCGFQKSGSFAKDFFQIEAEKMLKNLRHLLKKTSPVFLGT